jgi:glycosyltransferase involved in cell wall biosynthesis
MDPSPTISVIIPTHDRPNWLMEAVASVQAQTLKDFEIILVVSNADQRTHAAVDQLCTMRSVRAIRTKDATASAARNRGLESANGEWCAFLDDDDIWMRDKLNVQLSAAKATRAELVGCNYLRFNNTGDIPNSGYDPRPEGLTYAEALMLDNYIAGGSTPLVRTHVLHQLGGFDEQIVGAEDWDMWRRVSWNYHVHFVDQVLVKYRVHDHNKSRDPSKKISGLAANFAKILRDAPPHLHHMIPLSKQRCVERLVNWLVEEGTFARDFDKSLLAELSKAKGEVDELRADGRRLQGSLDEIQKLLREHYEPEILRLKSANNMLEGERKKFRQEIVDYRAQVLYYAYELSLIGQRIDSLKAQIQEMERVKREWFEPRIQALEAQITKSSFWRSSRLYRAHRKVLRPIEKRLRPIRRALKSAMETKMNR